MGPRGLLGPLTVRIDTATFTFLKFDGAVWTLATMTLA